MNFLKSGGDLTNRGMRPSPKESATLYPVGYRKQGQDGNMYVIVMASNGVKRWSKTSSAKPSVKKPSTPKPIAAKTKLPKKTIMPKAKSTTSKAKTTKAKTTKAKSKKSTVNTGRAWTLDRMYSSKEEYEKSYHPKRKKPAKKHARQKSA